MIVRSTYASRLLVTSLLGLVPAGCANEVTCDELAEADGGEGGAPSGKPNPRTEPERPPPQDDVCLDSYGEDCCEIPGCGKTAALGCVGETRDCYLHRDLCRSDEVCLVEKTRGDRGCDDGYGFADGVVGVCVPREVL